MKVSITKLDVQSEETTMLTTDRGLPSYISGLLPTSLPYKEEREILGERISQR